MKTSNKQKSMLITLMMLLILMKSTKEESINNFDFDKMPDFLSLFDEHQKLCNSNNNFEDNNKECQYLMSENIKDYSIKRKLIEASKLPLRLMMNNIQESDNKNHCSCGMDYRLADLGYSYFPRYIVTGICRKGGCRSKYAKCSPKTYNVHVLKRKEQDEPEIVERKDTYLTLPESLKNSWTLETVIVNVACQCAY